jgi:sigma-B regulation protein RsbU (phosphoserine phosphatase)
LQRLNRELVEQALSDQPFITMAYGQFDQRTRTLGFARAGHPHPVFVPAQGPLCLWEAEGALLGIFDTIFPLKTYQLQPGDKTLFYTDGMDSASLDGYAPGPQSLLACAERHRALPIQELVPQLVRDLFGKETPSDDLTLLGMEVSGEW